MIQLLPFIMTVLKSQQAPEGEVQCVTSEEVASLHKSEPFTFLNSLTAVHTVKFGLQNTEITEQFKGWWGSLQNLYLIVIVKAMSSRTS